MKRPVMTAFESSASSDRTLPVRVIRSARRRRTSQARIVDGVLEVRIPDRMDAADEERTIADFVERFERRRRAAPIDVTARAERLADAHDLPRPGSIRWVDNQSTRWASCTAGTGAIRLSTRMAGFPRWVIDGVIVHELAHLVEANHSPAFWALANRYELMERTRGFLIAKGWSD